MYQIYSMTDASLSTWARDTLCVHQLAERWGVSISDIAWHYEAR